MRMQRSRGNVFVGNLPTDFSEEQLAQVFDPFGIVLSATIARDPETGKRLRHGFVDIATERAAKLAVAGLNGTAIDGRKISVQISERPARKPAVAAARRPAPMVRGTPQHAGQDPVGPPAVNPRKPPTFQVERRALPRRI
jgi:RNA recognition motif-containing protein